MVHHRRTVQLFVSENIAKELEQAFADLEEIEGALKVIRSFPLISLSFFKKLKTIRGEKMEGSYALHVVDNQNLQSLFDHPVEILAGKLFVHFNPKLCIQHIEYLTNYTTDVEDVSRYTNGDEVACKWKLKLLRFGSLNQFVPFFFPSRQYAET